MAASPGLAGPSTSTSPRFALFAQSRARSGSLRASETEKQALAETGSMSRTASSSRTRTFSNPVDDSASENRNTFWPRRKAGVESSSVPSTPVNDRSDPLSEISSSTRAKVTAGTLAGVPTSPSAGDAASASTSPAFLRLVPHLETGSRSLHFEPVSRSLQPSQTPLRIGRFNERAEARAEPASEYHVTFRSKVVSRLHAEIWAESDGRILIRDTKSSSGTFLNHIRLGAPGHESRAFVLRDGDVLQLGVDYQGGTEAMYRCVKIRVELNRSWQRGVNAYNVQTFKQIQALGSNATGPLTRSRSEAQATIIRQTSFQNDADTTHTNSRHGKAQDKASESSSTTCCICLFSVMVCQALFIAPCSHVYHYKCILPLLKLHHPGFSCPLCRTFADLDADVELDDEWEPDEVQDSASEPEGGDAAATSTTIADVLPEGVDDAPLAAFGSMLRRNSIASSLHSRPFVDASDIMPGEFDPRRGSFVVISGADGQPAAFPITGRSSRTPSLRSVHPETTAPSRPVAPRGDLTALHRLVNRQGEAGA